jgi:hypothetical protein
MVQNFLTEHLRSYQDADGSGMTANEIKMWTRALPWVELGKFRSRFQVTLNEGCNAQAASRVI